jgi:hypothetical protein
MGSRALLGVSQPGLSGSCKKVEKELQGMFAAAVSCLQEDSPGLIGVKRELSTRPGCTANTSTPTPCKATPPASAALTRHRTGSSCRMQQHSVLAGRHA